MDLTNKEILTKFPSKIRNNIQTLLSDEPIGLSCMNMRINLNQTKLNSFDIYKSNSFILEVPFAGKYLSWEVIFNDEDLTFAPDFDFINDIFLIDPDIDMIEEEIPSWKDWNVENPKSLQKIIIEFLRLYKKFQLQRLEEEKFQRQLTEFTLLTTEADISQDDVEVLIDNNDHVHFLISIKTDFTKLPPYIQSEYFNDGSILNPSKDAATLKVSFSGTRITSNLQLSPKLECLIGTTPKLQIPQFNKDGGLVDYVPAIEDLIKKKIDDITQAYKLKNTFISTVLAYQSNGVLEYDTINFSKISVLIEVSDVFAIATIKLGKRFPVEKPEIYLSSVCSETNGKVVRENLKNYLYDSKWSIERIVQQMFLFLADAVPKFKANCTNY